MQMVDGQNINGVCRCHTSQLNKISTIVLVACLLGEHSSLELIDFVGGPFHVADTVFNPRNSTVVSVCPYQQSLILHCPCGRSLSPEIFTGSSFYGDGELLAPRSNNKFQRCKRCTRFEYMN